VENRTEAEWNRLLADAKKDGWLFPPYEDRAMGGPADCGNGAHRGRFGLEVYKGRAGGPADPELVKNYQRCVREHYYIYPGWTSEGPFYGSTMGSAVSDGEFVYAVTAQEGAACFDMQGNRRWAADLNCGYLPHLSAGVPIANHHAMSSPVLADDKLIYYHRDGVAMYGLNKATGKVDWKTRAPVAQNEFRDWVYLKGRKPIGYRGHMGPGGTPVVMRLPAGKAGAPQTTVAVSGHGMVVRVADGKLLGMVRMPAAAGAGPKADDDDAGDAGSDDDATGCTYNSWTAHSDTLFGQAFRGWVYAIRLAVAADELKQHILWRSDEAGDNRNPNLVYHGGRVYCGPLGKSGLCAFDALTGKRLASGPRCGGYSTSLGVADGKLVMRSSGWSGENARYATYTILKLADLKPIGTGLLVGPKPTGEVADRHIGLLGTPYIAWGVGGITCWGNRIFIRSNDYLWCIGDPAKPFANQLVRIRPAGAGED
jgi:outer membrane protein assembly factor BamB